MTHTSPFLVEPLDASFGAVVTDLKLTELGAREFKKLYDTWLEYALLIFPSQFLSNDEQIAFAKRFGDLEFDLVSITNVDKSGQAHFDPNEDWVKSIKGNMESHWKVTSSARKSQPGFMESCTKVAEIATQRPCKSTIKIRNP